MRIIQTSAVALLILAFGSTGRAVDVFTQPPIQLEDSANNAGFFSNQPIGTGDDFFSLERSLVYDNFSVSSTTEITGIDWYGGYDFPFDASADVEFVFRFYNNLPGDIPETIVGDYDGSGLVSQGDLNLPLIWWGTSFSAAGPFPVEWVNQPPIDGLISQNELNEPLINWGDSLLHVDRRDGGGVGVSSSEVSKTVLPQQARDGGLLLEYSADLTPFTLTPGDYWVSIQAEVTHSDEVGGDVPSWFWISGEQGDEFAYQYDEKDGDLLQPGRRFEGGVGCPQTCDSAFTLIGNVVNARAAGSPSELHALPEPGSGSLLWLASVVLVWRRRWSK